MRPHDNARPHVAKVTIEIVKQLGFEVLQHPAYSPDPAPSDYHFFAPLKDALRDRKCSPDEAVQKPVHVLQLLTAAEQIRPGLKSNTLLQLKTRV